MIAIVCIGVMFWLEFQRSKRSDKSISKEQEKITVARGLFSRLSFLFAWNFYFIIHAIYLIDGLIRNETMRLQMFNGCERAHDDDDDVRAYAHCARTLQQIKR